MKQTEFDRLMQGPRAAALLRNKPLLDSLLHAPDTRRLMELLEQKSEGGLKQAAAQGDIQALSKLVEQVMGSEEGSRLIRQLNQKADPGS